MIIDQAADHAAATVILLRTKKYLQKQKPDNHPDSNKCGAAAQKYASGIIVVKPLDGLNKTLSQEIASGGQRPATVRATLTPSCIRNWIMKMTDINVLVKIDLDRVATNDAAAALL